MANLNLAKQIENILIVQDGQKESRKSFRNGQ